MKSFELQVLHEQLIVVQWVSVGKLSIGFNNLGRRLVNFVQTDRPRNQFNSLGGLNRFYVSRNQLELTLFSDFQEIYIRLKTGHEIFSRDAYTNNELF